MPETIKEWLKSSDVKRCKANAGNLIAELFHRDPQRRVFIDPTVFYAPADGIVLYALENIKPTEAVAEIKGKKFSVRDLLDDPDYDYPSLVVGIFMTQYDVHINRMPTSGYVTEEHRTPYLFTPNVSMIFEENDILEEAMPKKDDLSYLFMNERQILRVYNPKIRNNYYMVQIAEKDVDVILNWGLGKDHTQGERFGMIRFGSQVDIVVPLTGSRKYELAVQRNQHVLAGVDPIIKIL